MAVTFVNATSGTNDASVNAFIAAPAGLAVGDLVLITSFMNNGAMSTPAGWAEALFTTTLTDPGRDQKTVWKRMESAADIDSFPLLIDVGLDSAWICVAYRGALSLSAAAGWGDHGTEYAVPAVTVPDLGSHAVLMVGCGRPTPDPLPTTGYVSRDTESKTDISYASLHLGDKAAPYPVAGDETVTVTSSAHIAQLLILKRENTAPNAPILNSPADGSTIDLGITQRFAWTPSDSDPGDSQSQYDLRYRIVGAPSWTTVGGSVPNAYRDIASGTFTAGDYEWQARTYDAAGLVGPYSASSFFTAAVPTGVPTITAPTSGGTVDTDPHTVTWSTAGGQDAYQVRRVADLAGAADTATVYYDTGEVASTAGRAASVPFETNNRYEHIQVRVKLDGLWSAWASIRVLVSYTPPTTPTVTLGADADSGSILVTISNPTPGAGEPSTSYNEVWIDDGDGETRRVTALGTNTSWRYWTPRSGVDYATRIRVVAVGDNGTTSSSEGTS